MESDSPRDPKYPVVNITSQSGTSVSGQGEPCKEPSIDAPSKPHSDVHKQSAADYVTVQIDQENEADHESQNGTVEKSVEKSETLVVKSFSKLASYSILRHQQTLADCEAKLHGQGSLDETELQALRDTLRSYYAEIRDAREIHNISHEDKGEVDVFPSSLKIDGEVEQKGDVLDNINDDTVKYVVQALVFVSLPLVVVGGMIREVRIKKLGGERRSFGDLLFSMEHVLKRISPYLELLARTIIAIIGSMALLVPVLILSYVETLKYRLLTVCLSVIVFAVCSMIVLRSKTSELVAIVAAYTAVLVVYVGGSPA